MNENDATLQDGGDNSKSVAQSNVSNSAMRQL